MKFCCTKFAARLKRGTVRGYLTALLMMGTATCALAQQPAEQVPLAPQTRLRIAVVQWMPLKGEYQNWNALGGEFVVSENGTVTLPVVGRLDVGAKDPVELADELAALIQTRTGLTEKPNTTVDVVRYPPVYVVGKVNKPGEYEFRPGLTVLQALALGGGALTAPPASLNDQTQLVGSLRAAESEILRNRARILRLEAEMADSKTFEAPAHWEGEADKRLAQQIIGQEKIIFEARRNEVERQSKRLGDLRDLLNAEIKVLKEKIGTADAMIATADRELGNVTKLVEKGVATAGRQSELERVVADRRADRLDQITAVMRAQQSLTETNRSLDGLMDKRQTDVAGELQTEQAKLEQSLIKRETSQRLLVEAISTGRLATDLENASIRYERARREEGEPRTTVVPETASLAPGDILKVEFDMPSQGTAAENVQSQTGYAMQASQ